MACMVKLLIIAVLLAAHTAQVHAARATPELEKCFESVGQASGISPTLLRAIARVESSLNPKAVNESHRNRTGSYDIGLMQINSRWLPRLRAYGITEKALFDACTSIEVGAWILVDLFRRHGPGWEAVGAYNAACTQLNADQCRIARDSYISKVRKAMDLGMPRPPTRNENIQPKDRLMASSTTAIKFLEFQE